MEIREGQYAALSNGIRLHYASAGDPGKPLLLFLHGFPEFWWAWQQQLSDFGGEYYAVAPDLRGYNLSDQPAEVSAYRAKHLVEDLRLLIAHLGATRCKLVAHDWGGALAWNLALSAPQLLERLVIINAPHPYLFWRALNLDPVQQAASRYMNWLCEPQSEALLAANDFKRMDQLLGDPDHAPPWYAAEQKARYRQAWAHGLRGPVNYYRASPLHPPTPQDPAASALQWKPEDFKVHVPTRVIWGESDIALKASLLDGLDTLVDDLAIVRIPEGTHWVVHEQPQRITQLIRGFL